jgi:hypothetical protein
MTSKDYELVRDAVVAVVGAEWCAECRFSKAVSLIEWCYWDVPICG